MTQPPRNIRALAEQGVLEIVWNDDSRYQLPFRLVRGVCPCASCVDEVTGVRTLDVDGLPDDIRPTEMSFTGNYALKFTWSDGHNTGLYTWNHLKDLCRSSGTG